MWYKLLAPPHRLQRYTIQRVKLTMEEFERWEKYFGGCQYVALKIIVGQPVNPFSYHLYALTGPTPCYLVLFQL